GMLFVLVGLIIWKGWSGFRGAARAQGTIVAFDARDPGTVDTHGIVYMPTVDFVTADGTPVRATSTIGTNPRPGRVGDTVTVLYDPGNPRKVRVQSGQATFTCLVAAFLLAGGAVAALGIMILIATGHP
ncbi:MAG: DUF3592 domain-containing protein, partial [Mycobacterium sp.]|nr:DUF3592 domain-containing protein [Mycobacterium sp.]